MNNRLKSLEENNLAVRNILSSIRLNNTDSQQLRDFKEAVAYCKSVDSLIYHYKSTTLDSLLSSSVFGSSPSIASDNSTASGQLNITDIPLIIAPDKNYTNITDHKQNTTDPSNKSNQKSAGKETNENKPPDDETLVNNSDPQSWSDWFLFVSLIFFF